MDQYIDLNVRSIIFKVGGIMARFSVNIAALTLELIDTYLYHLVRQQRLSRSTTKHVQHSKLNHRPPTDGVKLLQPIEATSSESKRSKFALVHC